jgi:hypothetical protein
MDHEWRTILARVCRGLPLWGHHWPYPNGTTLPILFPIADCQLPIDHWVITLDIQAVKDQRQIGNWKSAVENDLVPAEGFEPTLSSF